MDTHPAVLDAWLQLRSCRTRDTVRHVVSESSGRCWLTLLGPSISSERDCVVEVVQRMRVRILRCLRRLNRWRSLRLQPLLRAAVLARWLAVEAVVRRRRRGCLRVRRLRSEAAHLLLPPRTRREVQKDSSMMVSVLGSRLGARCRDLHSRGVRSDLRLWVQILM